MSQPKKRFGRSRNAQEDTQQFTLTERDRELAALAAEILPRNSAAASFERSAARNAGSSSVAAKDAVTDTELTGGEATAATAFPAGRGGTKKARRGATGGTGSARGGATAAGAASSDAAATDEDSVSGERTPAEEKARRKREREARRREAAAARAQARERRTTDYQPTPLWYKVVMIGLVVVGLLWIIAYYLFQGMVPIPGIAVWNLVIGLGFMLSGLIMTTQWR